MLLEGKGDGRVWTGVEREAEAELSGIEGNLERDDGPIGCEANACAIAPWSLRDTRLDCVLGGVGRWNFGEAGSITQPSM